MVGLQVFEVFQSSSLQIPAHHRTMRYSSLTFLRQRGSAAIFAPAPDSSLTSFPAHIRVLGSSLVGVARPPKQSSPEAEWAAASLTSSTANVAFRSAFGVPNGAARRWYDARSSPLGRGRFATPVLRESEDMHRSQVQYFGFGGDPNKENNQLRHNKRLGSGLGGGPLGEGDDESNESRRSGLISDRVWLRYGVLLFAGTEAFAWVRSEQTKPESEEQTVQNWSATKEVGCQRYVQPEDVDALKKAVEWANFYGKRQGRTQNWLRHGCPRTHTDATQSCKSQRVCCKVLHQHL